MKMNYDESWLHEFWRIFDMRKIGVVFGLLVMGSSVFAQTFSFGGHLSTNFEGVWPAFEIGINFSTVDVLAGVSFWEYQEEVSYDNYRSFSTDNKLDERWIRLYAGFAPKVRATEKLALSFPLFAKIQFRNDAFGFEDDLVYSEDDLKKADYFGYGLDFGARVYFALTKKWSVYGGAIMNVVYIADNKYTYWKDDPDETYTRETKSTSWLIDGLVEMGVRVTF
jgi:hypothetical protein